MYRTTATKFSQFLIKSQPQLQLAKNSKFNGIFNCNVKFREISNGNAYHPHRAAHISQILTLSRPSSIRFFSSTCSSNDKKSSINLGTLDTTASNPAARFYLSFTCKVCSGSNEYTISKQAYYHGVVITTCHHCKNNHLIADNLGWFQDPHGKNIEEILAAKGETVQKFIGTGINEYTPETPADAEVKRIE